MTRCRTAQWHARTRSGSPLKRSRRGALPTARRLARHRIRLIQPLQDERTVGIDPGLGALLGIRRALLDEVLVQTDGLNGLRPIDQDTLLKRENRIPDCRHSGVFESQPHKTKLPLANAMHQLNACERDRGAPETFEAEHGVRPGLDVTMVLFDQVIQISYDITRTLPKSSPPR